MPKFYIALCFVIEVDEGPNALTVSDSDAFSVINDNNLLLMFSQQMSYLL